MTYSIVAENLVKRYGRTTALAGADLAVRAGTVLGLLGPNGAGKTTTVRVLATLTRPDAGRALVDGHDVVRHAHQVRRIIGLTGQYASVDEMLTGSENLLLIGRLVGMSRGSARARAGELLARFGLADAGDRAVKTYSGGMRRRLDLAASLVPRPRVLFLDEPTTGLDPISRNEVWDMVRGLVSDGVTVLLTTQYLEEADQLADDIAVVDRGLVIATGTPAELKARTGGQTVTVRPVRADDLDAVRSIVSVATGSQPHVAAGLVSAQIQDPDVLPTVVRRLELAGVGVSELTLRGPSLDEVFLSLTGHLAPSPATGGGVGEDADAAGPAVRRESDNEHSTMGSLV